MKLFRTIRLSFALSLFALLVAGCASTGQADAPPLDPAAADAVVEVKGMSCPQCSFNISLLMDDAPEIDRTRVDMGSGQVYIAFMPEQTLTEAAIQDLVDRAGFTPGEVRYLKGAGQ